MADPTALSRRERQIVEAVVRLRWGTVADVRAELEDPPSYSAVRTTMGILVEKGHLQYRAEGRKYVYRPAQSRTRLRRKVLRDTVRNFFDGSAEELIGTLLDSTSRSLGDEELDRIAELVERARKGKR